MKFLKALVVCFLLALPFIYGYNIVKNKTWETSPQVQRLGQLPSAVTESSGLEQADEADAYFTHNDHGTLGAPASIFKVSETGKLLKTYQVTGAENQDWEDLTRDSNGNLYIADTGNNSGKREELRIFKVSATNPTQAQAISFSYADKPEKNNSKKGKKGKKQAAAYDSEAIFWAGGDLYLVTKDRNNSGEARLYRVPDSPGSHTATFVASKSINDKITSADLSPDGNKLALMSLGKIYLFKVSGSNYFGSNPQVLNLGNVGQTEGLIFKDNNTIVFTNEGGEIYKYQF